MQMYPCYLIRSIFIMTWLMSICMIYTGNERVMSISSTKINSQSCHLHKDVNHVFVMQHSNVITPV